MSDHLPEEIVNGILLRLPVKSLVKCTAVCKSWKSLIKSSAFIGTHLHENDDARLLLLNGATPTAVSPFYCLHWDNSEFGEYANLIAPPINTDRNFVDHAIGTCNGLVCLVVAASLLVLWNPLIRKYVCLPRPSPAPTKVLKKVLLLAMIRLTMTTSALHWAQCYDYVKPTVSIVYVKPTVSIVSFDLVNESFHQVEMPPNLMLRKVRDDTHVLRYGDSIALFETGSYEEVADFDLWVMKEYGVAESWTKLCTVSLPMVYILRPFGFRRTGEVVLQVAHDGDSYHWDMLKMLKLVDPKSKQVKDFGTDGYRYHFVGSFTESLVLLDQANAISY
ncbi:hypothetical protein M0R45_020127 [Rubus argutus]|uniref:F-box domain-containing protein n=1 Tax=Rubus argutus TaxID=59490 RepID=A0AAW1X8D8_RUBAR